MDFSLSDLLYERADRDPERTAILLPGEAITYRQLATEAAAIARLLVARGLSGARISLLLPNVPRFAAAFHGVLGAGGTVVMTNPLNSRREIEEQFADAGVSAVLTTESLTESLPAGTRALLLDAMPLGLRLRADDGEEWLPLPAGDPRPPLVNPGGGAPAAILFTAAERGRARGAILTHRNLIANLRSTVAMMGLDEEDRMLGALPQVHAFGLTVGMNAVLAAGGTIVPVERFHPVRTLELMSQAQTTVFAGVPAMFMGILSVAERNPLPPHALRITLSGGAPIHPEVQQRWEDLFGIPLRQGYGLTEASPVCLFNSPERPNRPGTLGLPIPYVEVTIRDSEGQEVSLGEVGEICVRGENVFAGYLNGGDEATSPLHDGWLRTGDLGRQDADGYIRFVGLIKPMFTRSGFNVYPRELERVIEADPRVARARVHAQPDPTRENEIVLEVEVAPGHTLSEEEVRALCSEKLAAYKQPGRVLIAPARQALL